MTKVRLFLLFALVFLTIGICAVPWPGDWSDTVPGNSEYEPTFVNLWSLWYGGEVLAGRQNLSHTDLINRPEGVDLYPNAPQFWMMLWSPFTQKWGPEIALNLATWIGLYLTFLCAALFFWEISGDLYPGVIAGAVFVLYGFPMLDVNIGSIATAAPFLIPLAAFFIVRTIDRGAFVYGLLAVVCSVAAFYYHFIFGAIIVVFAALAAVWALFDEGVGAMLRGIGLVGTILALASPLLLDYAKLPDTYFAMADSGFPAGARLHFLLLVPGVAIFGATVATWFIRKEAAFWLVVAAVFGLLIPLTAAWHPFDAHLVPDPKRWALGASLGLCAAIAMGLRRLLDFLEAQERDESLPTRGILFLVLITAAFILPNNNFRLKFPEAYTHLTSSSVLAVQDVSPSAKRYTPELYYQTRHKRPIMTPYNPLLPHFATYFTANGLAQTGLKNPVFSEKISEEPKALKAAGATQLLLRHTGIDQFPLKWQEHLDEFGPVVFQGDGGELHRLP